MTAHVLVGSKQEIAQKVAVIEGDIREAIVFVDEPSTQASSGEDIFAEMQSLMVEQPMVDDSRGSIYQRMETE